MDMISKVVSNSPIPILISGPEQYYDRLVLLAGYAGKAVSFYTQFFGFYPQDYLLIVPGQENARGGYPVDSGIIAIHGLSRVEESDWWERIIAHEISHMYWGFHVLEGDPVENQKLGWLTLGLGIYLDKLFVDFYDLKVDFHERIINNYNEAKDEGRNISFGLSQKEIEALDFDYYNSVLHGKSYAIMKSISEEIGSDDFIRTLKKTVELYNQKQLIFKDFLLLLKQEPVKFREIE